MKISQFNRIWEASSKKWLDGVKCEIDGKVYKVSQFCTIKKNYGSTLHKRYEKSKRNAKDLYFYSEDHLLNKYKRAAVLAYVISSASPIEYKTPEYRKLSDTIPADALDGQDLQVIPDCLFLRQSLGFFVGLESIVNEYPKDKVKKIQKIFHWPELTDDEKMAKSQGVLIDDFLMSVYKDMYYAHVYRNKNILTLANLYWALTQASELSSLSPLGKKERNHDLARLE